LHGKLSGKVSVKVLKEKAKGVYNIQEEEDEEDSKESDSKQLISLDELLHSSRRTRGISYCTVS
jgi:hypothetical protein